MTESMAQIRNLYQRSANMKPVLRSAKKQTNDVRATKHEFVSKGRRHETAIKPRAVNVHR